MMHRFAFGLVFSVGLALGGCGVDYDWDMKGAPKPPPESTDGG